MKMENKDYKKLYKDALERAKSKLHYPNHPCFVDVTEIFHELKESEDEKIRKELLEYLRIRLKCCSLTDEQTELITKSISWLEKQEKQGEQKSSWSEEDEKMLDIITDYFEWGIDYFFDENDCNKAQDWLKSLKERIE